MSLSSRLLAVLGRWLGAPAWHIGFSGGLDSTVLLHLLVGLREKHDLPPLSAIHVHHGLQPAADHWPEHCREVCCKLDIAFKPVWVAVAPQASLEAAARTARYAAFANALQAGELLLTAQHRDDQAETLLFRLLRGTGVKGLAGMPGERMLGQGRLVRPLLSTSRQELELYARSKRLHWIEDPSNENLEFSRNYLRQRIIPALLARWPQTQVSLARTASHMAEAQELLGELARIDLQTVKASSRFEWLRLPSLNFAALLGLSPVRQRNLLRYWLADFTLLPETGHWDGWDSLRDAASDAMPRWRLASGELVRANDFLWFLPKNWFDSLELRAQPWVHSQQALDLPGNGRIWLQQGRPGKVLEIRYRQGGEVISIPGRGRRDLKRLLNEAGIPSFVRYRLPLLYADNVLVAVANLPHCSMNGYSIGWVPPGLR